MSNTRFDRLVVKLRELFQLDQPELDFGIYRILHARADEITAFLENELLPQVKDALAAYKPADKAALQAELDEAVAQAAALGADPDSLPKVLELRDRLENEAVDLGALEADVYDHLYRFFSRYYHEGDFISLRRYKEGVYAIPYEGEEVKLYWANHDQYYIKTAEYLRDYAFRLRPDDEADPMRVHFRLTDVAEGEHGNVKEAEGKKRVFVLAANDFIAEEPGDDGVQELVLRFEYRPATVSDWPEAARQGKDKPPAQKDLLDVAVERILAVDDPSLARWISALSDKHTRADGSRADYSRLRAHLDRYSARNTFDYFIHKDLGGFLRRELDFYIKSEVMRLDDIDDESAPRVEQYLSKIKVIRRIALKIIDFLAQLEDFQRKLWLKKKFVTETSWCVSIATLLGIGDEAVREEMLAAIAVNDSQRAEWIALHGIDGLEADLERPAYSEPLTPEFVAAYPTLMIDTRHFDATFVERLLGAVGYLDELTDGVLFHSENFQALSLMQARYRSGVDCVHIDPPYNTKTSGFLYKNDYEHSSWLAMMLDRLAVAARIMRTTGSLLCHIDENEYERLHLLCTTIGLPDAGTIVWDKKNPMLGRQGVATQHEYVMWRAGVNGPVYHRRSSQRVILEMAREILSKHKGVTQDAQQEFARWITRHPGLSGGERAYRNLDDSGRVYQSAGMAAPEQRTDPKFFKPLIHPKTGKPCPVPSYGWSRTPETMQELLDAGDIIFGEDETTQPRRKLYLRDDVGRQVSSVIQDASRGKADVDALGLQFPYCHPLALYETLVGAAATSPHAVVLDFFAGSGTNGHAVIALNREEATHRKFVLVEVGDHFDTVLLPRLKKVTFAPEWKDGRPKRLATPEEAERSPRVFKIVRLESYEDTLNNLELKRSESQQSLLDMPAAGGADGLKEQYLLGYMLDVESRGSASLLNVGEFIDPRAYKLRVKRPGSDETREATVDLLETFNWLLGLRVRHIAAPQSFSASFKRDDEGRMKLDGRLKLDADGGWWFRSVQGEAPDGRKVLVIWRTRPGGDDAEGIEQDNLVLDEWFTRQGYSAKDSECDLIYVNGDNNLENLKDVDDRWKVRLIEEEFFRLMFDVEDV